MATLKSSHIEQLLLLGEALTQDAVKDEKNSEEGHIQSLVEISEHFLSPVLVNIDMVRVPMQVVEKIISGAISSSYNFSSSLGVEVLSATVPTNIKGINKLRRNTLDPAIDKAIKQAGNNELADVYLRLKELALASEPPFTGVIDKDALCYTDDNNEIGKIKKGALGKRLKIRQKYTI